MVGHKTICPDVEALPFGCFLQSPDSFGDEIAIGKMTCLLVAAQSNEIAVAAFVSEILEPRSFRLFLRLILHLFPVIARTASQRHGRTWRSCPTPVILTLNEVKGKNLGGEENDVMRLPRLRLAMTLGTLPNVTHKSVTHISERVQFLLLRFDCQQKNVAAGL